MKTKTIFWILLFATYIPFIGAGLTHILMNYEKDGIPITTEIQMNSPVGIVFQVSLITMGVFLGLILFAPRDKKEYTKYDFVKPKGEITK